MKKGRGVAIVLIFLVAAIITPPDIVSQCFVAVPMCLLYFISIFLSGIFYKPRRMMTTRMRMTKRNPLMRSKFSQGFPALPLREAFCFAKNRNGFSAFCINPVSASVFCKWICYNDNDEKTGGLTAAKKG